MAGLVEGLFGLSPYEEMQRRNQAADAYALRTSQMQGPQLANYFAGRAGSGVADIGAGMLGLENPAVREAKMREQALSGLDPNNPQSILERAAQIQNPRLKMELTLFARKQMADQQKMAADAARMAREEATARAAENRAKRELILAERGPAQTHSEYAKILIESGMNPNSPEFQQEMRNWAEAKMEGTKKGAGTTVTNVMPGAKEMKDVPDFRKKVQETIKPQLDAIYSADKASSALDLSIKENNPSAFQVARTQLAKTAGDSQISLREIEAAGGDPSLYGKIIDTGSVLFTGTPSLDTQRAMKRTIDAIRKVSAQKARKELDAQARIAFRSGYSAEDIDAALRFEGVDDAEMTLPVGKEITLKRSGKKVTRVD